jgi:hypothetical protein
MIPILFNPLGASLAGGLVATGIGDDFISDPGGGVPDPVPVWLVFDCPYEDQETEIFSVFESPYSDRAPIDAFFIADFRYGFSVEMGFHLPFGDAAKLFFRHALGYAGRPALSRRIDAPYGSLTTIGAAFSAVYSVVRPVELRHESAYSVQSFDVVDFAHSVRYSIGAERVLSVSNEPRLSYVGGEIQIESCELSCDEGSSFWIAKIEVVDPVAFAALRVGSAISLSLGIESFSLIVDGKQESRGSPSGSAEGVAEKALLISAISPLAMFDAPFSGKVDYVADVPMQASAFVQWIIGAVEWRLPDWIIRPPNGSFVSTTKLEAAKSIVEAIGGVIESRPDGSVVCRSLYPVPVTAYRAVLPDFEFFDSDVISVSEIIAPSERLNRVVVSNDSGLVAADDLEFVTDDESRRSGTVRGLLSHDRPVELVHTSDSATIEPRGLVTRVEKERVEFIEGTARARYPVGLIRSIYWKAVNLGAVQPAGKGVTSAVAGYSLADLEYETSALEWGVSREDDEEVQFVLMESDDNG